MFFEDFLEDRDAKFSKLKAILWLYEHAAYKATSTIVKGERIFLNRGQLSFSSRFLAEKFQWSHTTTYRFLRMLHGVNIISLENETGQCLITICNYDISDFTNEESETDMTRKKTNSSTKNKRRNKNNLDIESRSFENFENLIRKSYDEKELGKFDDLTLTQLSQETEACWEHWEASNNFPEGSQVFAFKRWLREALKRKNIKLLMPREFKETNVFEEETEIEEWRKNLKEEIGKPAYNSWIRNLTYDGDHTIIAPSCFIADWVKSHYLISIERSLSKKIIIQV
jgi:hypothetical protein